MVSKSTSPSQISFLHIASVIWNGSSLIRSLAEARPTSRMRLQCVYSFQLLQEMTRRWELLVPKSLLPVVEWTVINVKMWFSTSKGAGKNVHHQLPSFQWTDSLFLSCMWKLISVWTHLKLSVSIVRLAQISFDWCVTKIFWTEQNTERSIQVPKDNIGNNNKCCCWMNDICQY